MKYIFCEECGEQVEMPKMKSRHLLCKSCRILPRQWTDRADAKPATERELWGMREEPRDRMIGENWK